MRKLNINGSILMDAYIAFTCMLLMCSVFFAYDFTIKSYL